MSPNKSLEDRIRGHDESALVEYIDSIRPRLLAFVANNMSQKLRSKIEPDDILQEVSLDAVRSLAKVELGEREPFSWLCLIADRRIIDAHRRFFGAQKRAANREVALDRPSLDDDQHGRLLNMLVVSMTSPSAAFSRDLKHIQLATAVESLPEQCRDALRMRYVENRPTKEIARAIGKSDAAVRVMLTRTLHKLQELLGPDAAPR
ncbi:MAG: sigma-70 family RNA polymerase sigma factor [Pirellulales bacterium]